MNKPITSRVQHATDKGMVRQPLLNMGSPVKQKVKLENKAKETIEQTDSYQGGKLGVQTSKTTVKPDKLVKGKEIMKTVNTDTYDGSGGYASDKDWNAFLKTPKGKAYLEKNTKQVGTGTYEPDTYTPGTTTKTTDFNSYKVAVKGDAKRPWQRRFDNRGIKIGGRETRQAGNKIDKTNRKLSEYAKFDTNKDGKFSAAEKSVMGKGGFLGLGKSQKKFEKLGRKLAENKAEYEGFKGGRDAAIAQSIQSVKMGNKIDLGERDARLSDAGGFDKQREALSNSSSSKMKSSPYKMMPKSPAMKALIGNQKNLPDALKQKILNSKG
jgi:hypothetical protein